MLPAPETILIRPATLADVPAITAIHVRGWQTAYRGMMDDAFLDALPPDAWIPRWTRDVGAPDDVTTVCVAEEIASGRVVGFCSVSPQVHVAPGDELLPPTGELQTLFVDATFRGGGVGTRLIARAEERMREMGCARGVLFMLTANHPAQRFYERMGWQLDGYTLVETFYGQEVPVSRLAKALG